MEQQIIDALARQEQKIDEMTRIVDKMRKYMLYALISVVVSILVPFVGLLFAIPSFLSTYTSLGL